MWYRKTTSTHPYSPECVEKLAKKCRPVPKHVDLEALPQNEAEWSKFPAMCQPIPTP